MWPQPVSGPILVGHGSSLASVVSSLSHCSTAAPAAGSTTIHRCQWPVSLGLTPQAGTGTGPGSVPGPLQCCHSHTRSNHHWKPSTADPRSCRAVSSLPSSPHPLTITIDFIQLINTLDTTAPTSNFPSSSPPPFLIPLLFLFIYPAPPSLSSLAGTLVAFHFDTPLALPSSPPLLRLQPGCWLL